MKPGMTPMGADRSTAFREAAGGAGHAAFLPDHRLLAAMSALTWEITAICRCAKIYIFGVYFKVRDYCIMSQKPRWLIVDGLLFASKFSDEIGAPGRIRTDKPAQVVACKATVSTVSTTRAPIWGEWNHAEGSRPKRGPSPRPSVVAHLCDRSRYKKGGNRTHCAESFIPPHSIILRRIARRSTQSFI